MGAYISNQVKIHVYHITLKHWTLCQELKNTFECAFEPSTIKGSAFPILPLFKCAFEPSLHSFSSTSSSSRPSKVVHFLSYLLLSALSSPHLIPFRARLRALDHQRWCISYPTSFWVRLRDLNSFLFERAFESSTIKGGAFPILPSFECTFEPSPHSFSSAPSNPRPSKEVHFLSYLLF